MPSDVALLLLDALVIALAGFIGGYFGARRGVPASTRADLKQIRNSVRNLNVRVEALKNERREAPVS